jgi:ABC-type amino acid transport substrate-binding protein
VCLISLSYSQSNQKSIDPDSYYADVLYKHVVKANQAYTEIKYTRVQIGKLESIIQKKDTAFNKLLQASRLTNQLNKEYEEVFVAQGVKLRACEDLQEKYDSAYKKLRRRGTFMQIGTPVIVISVGILCGVGGYYIAKAIK